MKFKHWFGIFLVVIMVAMAIPFSAVEVKAADGMTLEQLKAKFPYGDYWNHYVTSTDEASDYLKNSEKDKTWAERFADSVTTYSSSEKKGCALHTSSNDLSVFVNKYDCNYFDGGNQCCGFARRLAFLAYGTGTRVSTWTEKTSISSVKAGDVVKWKTGKDAYGNDTWHHVFVTSVSGTTIKVGECNVYGTNDCRIRWDEPYDLSTKSDVRIYSAPSEWNGGNAPANLGDNFYATILNTDLWKPINNDDDNYVRLRTEKGISSELWLFDRQDDGCYVITSAKDGQTLALDGGKTTNGNPVVAWDEDWGGYYQRWYIYPQGDGYVLQSKHYKDLNLVLDLKNDQGADGTAVVTSTRDNSSGQIWSIYKNNLQPTTLSVAPGKSATQTTFTWWGAFGETGYNLKIWKDKVWVGDAYHIVWNASSGCGVQLPAGTYQAYVDAYNYYGWETSNIVTFTVSPSTYSISFNANGGSGAPAAQTKTYGINLTLSSTKPTRTGYTFLGWSTSSTATGATYAPGATFSTNANTTLYAVWKKGCEGGNHSYSYKVTKNPTVSATGTLTGTCSKCSGTTTVTLPKLNTTDYSYKVTKAATCTATGTGRYTWKTTTYGSYYFDVTIPATGHSYTNKVTAPTCTAQGYTTHTCACGHSYEDTYTNATGHSYAYKVTKNPTVSATGTLTGTCSKCSGTTTVTLPKLNTTDYSYKVTKSATCTATGTGRYTWKTTTYGSYYFDVTISATGHSYTHKVTAPTCTAQGYTTHTCACGHSYKDAYTNATGHSYSYMVTKNSTVSATGILTGTCSTCSGTTTVTLPKLNTTDYSYKVTKSATCTATGTGRYTWKTTTYGSYYFDVTIPATGHNYTNKVTAPTCTAQGYTTHTCACGHSYKDAYTNATGHSFGEWIEEIAATTKAEGVEYRKCQYCQETQRQVIPKLTVVVGWQMIDNAWYYLNDSGVMMTGWLKDGGAWYYMNSSGVMMTGWVNDGGTWYYMDGSGAMMTGWVNDGGAWYYLSSSGAMQTGWVNDGGTWYYMNGSGAMMTGWINDGGVWYYMNAGGAMHTGWLLLGNTWYYMTGSGAMATGWIYDGAWYFMDASGAWVA